MQGSGLRQRLLTESCILHPASFLLSVSVVRNGDARAELRFDFLIHFAKTIIARHANSIANRFGAGAPVTDDRDPFDPQQRRAAIFGIIEPLLELAKGGPRQQRAGFRLNRRHHLLPEQLHDEFKDAFTGL
ncbi:MAG: hypothetical protein V7641_1654 [Blastocatellia bacterium]